MLRPLKPEDRLRTYAAFADITRKWVLAMDAKAAFISALNGAVIAFLWAGMRLHEDTAPPLSRTGAVAATALALVAVAIALWSLLPREKLRTVFGGALEWSHEYKPISYYGFISSTYEPSQFAQLEAQAGALDDQGFAQEALEQHFTVSHIAQVKSLWVARAGYLTLIAILFAVAALLLKAGGL